MLQLHGGIDQLYDILFIKIIDEKDITWHYLLVGSQSSNQLLKNS